MFSAAQLAKLLGGQLIGPGEVQCLSVCADSRQAKPGAVFVAIKGNAQDGGSFIEQALKAGAVAVVAESELSLLAPVITVSDARVALSRLAALFSGEPAKELVMIGVTGTNGKTTTTYLIEEVLTQLKRPMLRMGTVSNRLIGTFDEPSALTTPDPVNVHKLCSRARAAGAFGACLEVSSHALDQHRADDLDFSCAVFTNLTRDHLDYHQTMERYQAAKRKLFELLLVSSKPEVTAVINSDDPAGKSYSSWCQTHPPIRLLTYGRNQMASIRLVKFEQSLEGLHLELVIEGVRHVLTSPLLGEFNAENIMAALGAMLAVGCEVSEVVPLFSNARGAPGRLERVSAGGKTTFVDYAHTPDALERALITVRPICRGSLWVLFGCGGDRDAGKRPLMGAIAGRLADRVVVTSDNPRTEDPNKIITDIVASGIEPVLIEPDRRAAISKLVAMMQPGDVALVAGKGHEDYQIIGSEKRHFSDQEELRAALGA